MNLPRPEASSVQRKNNLPDSVRKAACVVPGYRELYGARGSNERLLDLISRYPVAEWFSFLSRLQTIVAPPNHTDLERHAAVFQGVFSPTMRQRLSEWAGRHARPERLLTFVEPQIATLQQLVLMHAPDEGERRIQHPGDYDALCEALLITWDLMHIEYGSGSLDRILAALMQEHARMLTESADALSARALHAYQLTSESPSAPVQTLNQLFEDATGVSLRKYLIGGVAVAIREYAKSPEKIAEGWLSTPLAERCENPLEAECLEAFYAVRCGTVAQVREEVRRHDGDRPIAEFSLIGLAKFPIVGFPGVGRFVTSLAALADSLFAGVRHAVLTSVLRGDIPGMTEQRLGGIWGEVFQEYVLDILRTAFGPKLIHLRPSAERERADCLVTYPDKLLVIEVKGSHPKGTRHRGALSYADRERELQKLGVPKAASQIAATIEDLRLSEIKDDALITYDWTITPVVPLIVTLQRLPLLWKLWPMYERLTEDLRVLPMQDQIARTRFLWVGEVEQLPDLAETAELGGLLLRWANDVSTYECPLSHYLEAQGVTAEQNFMRHRVLRTFRFLAKEIGLDPDQITVEA